MEGKLAYEVAVGSVFVGRKIDVKGVTTPCSCSFNIYLASKTPCGIQSIPLLISVRLGQGCIVSNSLTPCGWGQEENHGCVPIVRGQAFTIGVECKTDMFSISINGCHFYDYVYRLPIETINNVSVTGDVTECEVIVRGTPQQTCDDKTLYPNLLYSSVVAGMFPKRRFKIEGATTKCCTRFVIILKSRNACDTSIYTNPLIISVLFDKGYIIRTTFNNSLEEEEKCGGMPITKGEPFTIEIVCKPEVFTLIINGCHFCDYKHRLPYKTVNVLSVRGDDHVSIRDVIYSGTPPQQTWNDTIPHGVAFQPLC